MNLINVKCPNCRHNNPHMESLLKTGLQVLTCETESGGCGDPFVADVKYLTQVRTTRIRHEWTTPARTETRPE